MYIFTFSRSLSLFLVPAVAPVCRAKEVTVIGASLEESVKVRCEVDADPGEVDFVWEFNNSGENFEVAPTKFDGDNGTMSELVYTPESERDYGALTCWGRNAIGKQEVPCIYQVIPAGDVRQLKYYAFAGVSAFSAPKPLPRVECSRCSFSVLFSFAEKKETSISVPRKIFKCFLFARLVHRARVIFRCPIFSESFARLFAQSPSSWLSALRRLENIPIKDIFF